MRGLETRVLLARARVMALVDQAKADEMMIEVYLSAQHDGMIDARKGFTAYPMQFEHEPDLRAWWDDGYEHYELGVEMANCYGCNDDTGNPCCYHG